MKYLGRKSSRHSRSTEPEFTEPEFTEPASHAPLSKADVRTIFYGLMLGMFLSALNQTIVRDLGAWGILSWVITAFLLSSTVVSPLYGKLPDTHGRRVMMLVAIG